MLELAFLSVGDLAPLLRSRQVSPLELVKAVLDRIDRYNDTLHSYITVTRDTALEEAMWAEQEIMSGQYRGPLHGIPVAHKDIFFTSGVLTTGHSKLRATYVPDYDATVVRRFKEAGTILMGKLNTHEFACGGMEVWGEARNPWDLERVPSGSSSGSGNALAAGLTTVATGSDTGGSIRAPASFCGIVGLKPTYGRVSRYGVFPLSSNLDNMGPMARTVLDTSLCMNAIAGYDPLDPTSSSEPVPDFTAALTGDVRGLRVGICRDFYFEDLDPEVKSAVDAAIRKLEELGAILIEIKLPHIYHALEASMTIIAAEGASFHEHDIRTRPELFSEKARAWFERGIGLTATAYVNAQQMRRLVAQDFTEAFEQVDVIVSPTAAVPAFKTGAKLIERNGQMVDWRRAMGSFTNPANLAAIPAMSVPCGFTAAGLPIGLQIMGRAFDESTVLRVGDAYEKATTWHTRHPEIAVTRQPQDFRS